VLPAYGPLRISDLDCHRGEGCETDHRGAFFLVENNETYET